MSEWMNHIYLKCRSSILPTFHRCFAAVVFFRINCESVEFCPQSGLREKSHKMMEKENKKKPVAAVLLVFSKLV